MRYPGIGYLRTLLSESLYVLKKFEKEKLVFQGSVDDLVSCSVHASLHIQQKLQETGHYAEVS